MIGDRNMSETKIKKYRCDNCGEEIEIKRKLIKMGPYKNNQVEGFSVTRCPVCNSKIDLMVHKRRGQKF